MTSSEPQLTARDRLMEGGRSNLYSGAEGPDLTLPYTVRDGTVPRRWVLQALTMNTTSHIITGSWRRPGDRGAEFNTIKYWTDLAQLLERGKFHALFLADTLGSRESYQNSIGPGFQTAAQVFASDPVLWISAAAAVTKGLNFGITQSVTYEKPFTVARRFSTLDHLTEGRVAINLVTSTLDSAALNHGLKAQIPHDERYKRADEYAEVLYKLWESSWADDAVVKDAERDIYADPAREGEYFSVAGPSSVEPSPQRTPLLYQAGSSPAGVAFGAKHGEALFINQPTIEKTRAQVQQYRTAVHNRGRDAYSVKVVLGITIFVAETDEAAQEVVKEVHRYSSKLGAEVQFAGRAGQDLSLYPEGVDLRTVGNPTLTAIINSIEKTYPHHTNWTREGLTDLIRVGGLPYPPIVGSPTTVADHLQRIITEADIDGFNIAWAQFPDTYEAVVDLLVPELQRRGVHWLDYPKREDGRTVTARESLTGVGNTRLPDDHYGAKFKWRAGEAAPEL